MAPGPPIAMAVATPAILPNPTEPPIAVEIASIGFSTPFSSLSSCFLNTFPSVCCIIYLKYLIWKNPDRTVKYTPVDSIRMIRGGPQIKSFKALIKFVMFFSLSNKKIYAVIGEALADKKYQ